jgi:hypothetical protein
MLWSSGYSVKVLSSMHLAKHAEEYEGTTRSRGASATESVSLLDLLYYLLLLSFTTLSDLLQIHCYLTQLLLSNAQISSEKTYTNSNMELLNVFHKTLKKSYKISVITRMKKFKQRNAIINCRIYCKLADFLSNDMKLLASCS